MPRTHLLIPDTQVKPGLTNLKHITACGKLAADVQPEVIVMIGDWWDMESLSLYDRGKKAAEGVRYQRDIDAGNRAMDLLMNEVTRPRGYSPRLVFCLGNHEQRIQRHVEAHPWLDGKLGYDDLRLDGWTMYDFLEIVTVDGVAYSHYFVNPHSGTPIGGTAQNKLKRLGFSFTQGHCQQLEYARLDRNNGAVHNGLVAGAFYQHRERYLGHQGNSHWRGVALKHDVVAGNYDLEVVSLKRLLKEYG